MEITRITRVTCLRSICFYFHLCSFYIYISKGFSQIYLYHGCGGLWWNVSYHRQRPNTCRLRPVAVAVTGMYTRYKDISRVQFFHLFSPNLQGREKDLLRRKAQRHCWRRLLRYIFQGFMQGDIWWSGRDGCVLKTMICGFMLEETPFLSISWSHF